MRKARDLDRIGRVREVEHGFAAGVGAALHSSVFDEQVAIVACR